MRNKVLAFAVALAAALFAGACEQNVTSIKFGVVTDVHHYSGQPAGTRYYQASLGKLREALATFEKEKVEFVADLGDTIDRDLRSFAGIMPVFEAASMPVYHVVGNHDFSVEAGQEERVLPALGLKESYYAFSRGDWVFVVLNGFELRFLLPVLPESASNLWNDAEVVALIEKYPSVKAYFCGHNHAGDYVFKNGIHYLTFQAMVETPDSPAYAVVTIEEDAILVQGFGREPSRELKLVPGR